MKIEWLERLRIFGPRGIEERFLKFISDEEKLIYGSSYEGASNIALQQLITEVENTDGNIKLDLSCLKLEELPQLQHLENVVGLDLSCTALTSLNFENWPRCLEILDLSYTKLTSINIEKLPRSLVELYLYNTHITSLDFVNLPRGLITLSLSNTKITWVDAEYLPRNLVSLHLSDTKLTSINVEKLPRSLRTLALSFTEQTSLDTKELPRSLVNLSLSGLKLTWLDTEYLPRDLVRLHLRDSNLTTIDIEKLPRSLVDLELKNVNLANRAAVESMVFQLSALKFLSISKNPLLNIPESLTYSIKQLRAYFSDLKAGSDFDAPIKLMLLGNGRTGKTSIKYCLKHLTAAPKGIMSTHGIERDTIRIKEWQMNTWDFAGQEIYHSTHRLFLKSNVLYLVVWAEDPEPDEDNHIYELDYWIDLIRTTTNKSLVTVVKNQIDKKNQRPERHPLLLLPGYQHLPSVATSATTYRGIEKLGLELGEQLSNLHNNKVEVPKSWLNIETWLKEKNAPYIDLQEFTQYCAKSVTDPMATLSYLNSKDSCLYLPEVNKIILDPNWAIKGAYRLFEGKEKKPDSARWIITNMGGEASRTYLYTFYSDYDLDHDFDLLLTYMAKVDMCFKHPFKEQTYVFPSMLPMKPRIRDFSVNTVVKYRFGLKVLHRLIIERVICRTAYLSREHEWWRNGIRIWLEQFQCSVVIESSTINKNIVVYIKDLDVSNISEVLAIIRNTLLEIALFAPVLEEVCLGNGDWVNIEKIIDAHNANNPYVVDVNNNQVVCDELYEALALHHPNAKTLAKESISEAIAIEEGTKEEIIVKAESVMRPQHSLTLFQNIVLISSFLIDCGLACKYTSNSNRTLTLLTPLFNHKDHGTIGADCISEVPSYNTFINWSKKFSTDNYKPKKVTFGSYTFYLFKIIKPVLKELNLKQSIDIDELPSNATQLDVKFKEDNRAAEYFKDVFKCLASIILHEPNQFIDGWISAYNLSKETKLTIKRDTLNKLEISEEINRNLSIFFEAHEQEKYRYGGGSSGPHNTRES